MRIERTAGAARALALAVVFALGACGGSSDDSGEGAALAGADGSTEEQAAGAGIPDTMVLDLATDTPVSVRSTLATDKPTLYWFWAPF